MKEFRMIKLWLNHRTSIPAPNNRPRPGGEEQNPDAFFCLLGSSCVLLRAGSSFSGAPTQTFYIKLLSEWETETCMLWSRDNSFFYYLPPNMESLITIQYAEWSCHSFSTRSWNCRGSLLNFNTPRKWALHVHPPIHHITASCLLCDGPCLELVAGKNWKSMGLTHFQISSPAQMNHVALRK